MQCFDGRPENRRYLVLSFAVMGISASIPVLVISMLSISTAKRLFTCDDDVSDQDMLNLRETRLVVIRRGKGV
jgi:hypothetical protein